MGRRVRSSKLAGFIIVMLVVARAGASEPVRVQGPGAPPNIGFACCEQELDTIQGVLANPELVADLHDLHASIAVPIVDFSPQRADVVRELNRQGIPAIAWIVLPKEEGYYLTADSAPQAAVRVTDFENWTREQHLQWTAVGLDVEPDFNLLGRLRGHPWRMFTTFLRRSFAFGRMKRAKRAYANILAQIRSQGYPVQIYQMPYIPAERSVHTTLLDRWLGTVDVRGDQDYLMLYTSFARPIGAGMIWSLGPHAQGIAIGSTDGDGAPGAANGPLDWNEFSRDLVVASHFSREIGVYDLEGCVRQGFLPRLAAFNWSQSVEVPADQAHRAARFGLLARIVLWIVSNLIYIAVAVVLLVAWLASRRRRRKRHATALE